MPPSSPSRSSCTPPPPSPSRPSTHACAIVLFLKLGQAVTEPGAISAVAAFFRQKLAACAWTENATPAASTNATAVPPVTASATGAPPLLRLPLGASGATVAATAGYREGAPAAPPRQSLDLVVSRGPGPAFSASETRIAAQAAALLRQALARIRDRDSLAEAEAALESSLRGMQEASEAVTVLVGERERRAQRQEQQRADAAAEHGRVLSAAGDKLARSRAEAEGLRRRLAEAEEAVTVVAAAANNLYRAASGSDGGVLGRGAGDGVRVREGVGARVGEGGELEAKAGNRARTEVGDLIAEVERAARKSLRCFFARVERASKDGAADPAADQGGEGEAFPGTLEPRRESLREPRRAGERSVNESRARKLKLRVPVPQCCDPATPLVLSLRRKSRENDFTEGDERLASTLAACLSTAMLALREKQRSLHCARIMEADRRARAGYEETAAAAAAAASAEARERRERAIAGTRALAAAARASEARAESVAEAAARAQRHTEALRHLLSGLGATGGDHAAVAEAVAERAAAAVPACVSAVLLTPRQGDRRGGRHGTGPPRVDAACGGGFVFSPDPRVWAACASEEHGQRASSGRNEGRRRKSGRWAEAIGRAASQAASSGKTVCVRDRGVDSSLGTEAGASSPVFVACFSPVHATVPTSASEIESKTNAYGAKENLRPGVSGGVVATNAVPGEQVEPRCADRSVCVIAWMLFLHAGVLDADEIVQSSTCSPPPAATTRSFAAPTTTAAAAAEGMMITTPAALPSRVSAAIEGVAHAVSLAVSSASGDCFDLSGKSRSASFGTASGWDGLVASSPTTGRFSTINARHSREGARHELFLGGGSEGNFSRDEDLSRLREGTSALSGRVQTLERRAAGLRASEARSAAALARAKVDAMAVKGQLQLAGLERDRLLSRLKETEDRAVRGQEGEGRRPLAAARSTGNRRDASPPAVPLLGWREEGGRTASAFLSAWSPPSKERTGMVQAVTSSARQGGGSRAVREVTVPGGVGTAAAATTSTEGKAAEAATDSGGGEATSHLDSPESVVADDTSSSSQALQRMASLHARLSDSLRRGGVS